MTLETKSLWKAHGGMLGVYTHLSEACACPMTFAVYVPPHAEGRKLPVLWYLSGLTCTHANVTDKGEFRAICAELGIIFVAPDTSPRGEGVADDLASSARAARFGGGCRERRSARVYGGGRRRG